MKSTSHLGTASFQALLFISKYSMLYGFLNKSRTQSTRNQRFSPIDRGDRRMSFILILRKMDLFKISHCYRTLYRTYKNALLISSSNKNVHLKRDVVTFQGFANLEEILENLAVFRNYLTFTFTHTHLLCLKDPFSPHPHPSRFSIEYLKVSSRFPKPWKSTTAGNG